MAVPASPPALDAAPLVGAVLDGRYALTAHIATGGMGAVFRAQHVHLRKDVAVKLLRPELCSAPDLVERFRREAEIASHLEHENIVKVTDFGRSEAGQLFLVMELLEGESLFDRLRSAGRLAPAEAVPVLQQVCAGLSAAHGLGVVHRDLKPENVFLARGPGGREVTKILDFGIAKLQVAGSPSATQAGMVVGTPEYLSPEQAMGLAVDARADLYTVGILAFRTLTGRHPFHGTDARTLLVSQASAPVPRLSEAVPELAHWPQLVEAVAAACQKDPAHRPQTAAALGALLGDVLRGQTPERPFERLRASGSTTVPTPVPSPTPVLLDSPAVVSLPGPSPAARWRTGALSALRRAASASRGAWRGVLAAALILALGWGGLRLLQARSAAHAEALLEADQASRALAEVDAGLARHPGDRPLLLLRARALAHLPGRAAQALDAYADAALAAPLEPAALEEVAAYLDRERSLADRAARILRQTGSEAVAPVAALARDEDGLPRLRALALLRDLGAEDAVDRATLYAELLGHPSCDLRRAAAQRLGELAEPAALPALRAASQLRACGAPEAGEAARRIEAARSQVAR